MSRFSDILEKINTQAVDVCVVGLGYIGLPTALFYAAKGLRVIGFDTNVELISNLEKGIVNMEEDGLQELVSQNLPAIRLVDSYEKLDQADVFVLCLPSPIDKDRQPVFRFLENSILELGQHMNKEGLILVESTVPVGTTERLANLFAEKSGLTLDDDFWFAHCPERVLPGKIVSELETNHRLVGGVTQQSTELATAFLASVFDASQVHSTSAMVSEAAKLAENSFRDVNVAFANELARICNELEIDVSEVIDLANLHPRVDILNPGIGVGGYCLPKDGWLLVQSIRDSSFSPELIPAARRINDSMPSYILSRIRELAFDTHSLKPIVGVLGLSFKPNVSDTRNSPAVELVHLLLSSGIGVVVYDPFVRRDYGAKKAETLDNFLNSCEILVLSVGHKLMLEELDSRDLSEKVLLDPSKAAPHLKKKVKKYIGLSG